MASVDEESGGSGMAPTVLVQKVVDALTDDLRDVPWRGLPNRLAGHCYVACEAIFHLSGKKMRPHFICHEGAPHWYLVDDNGKIIDPTRGDGLMEIEVPGGPPHVVFREQDIEGMRAVVAAHDARKP